ncbi:Uncharacterized protein OS=Candidatus Entotheonella sp. TSY1 GN=ETSY1_16225 PE=4 SV=1: NACHT: LRR_4 [Gemmata massiliana]|uniref:NACHT domain-containing protein n=1 Tax=Gemmata massiliana TaxID=1210884 RepID=A0A6P2CX06_9BACT|nr:leucine-rich repeat domain-containing protein [Gemmata massiliana]VTR93433.1 Uncharacterized protein OS=Candidatus Entotheonella sp. TSY1 GN=ETSY1_16225 PE=4 SV=1: NACHT: LRR_4 [Gemmata massiliana]
MILSTTIGIALATACGKFLLKRFVGKAAKELDPAGTGTASVVADSIYEGVGGSLGEGVVTGLADFAKDRIKDAGAQREAERAFSRLGDQIVERLSADLHSQFAAVPRERWDKVLIWVNAALGGNITASFVVQNKVDSAKLYEALRVVSLNIPGPAPGEETELFEAALREASRHLAAAASKLPKFEEENARASLELLNALSRDIDQVLDDVRFIREQVDKAQGPGARDEFALDYRQAVVCELDRVELFGVDLPDELRRAKLTDAYVTLNLEDAPDEDESDDGAGTATISTETAFDTLLPETGRLLVRGGAGSGKTTLIKWAAINAARMALPDQERQQHLEYENEPDGPRIRPEEERAKLESDWRQRMPFIVFLRNCQHGKLPPPKMFPALVAQTLADPPVKWVETILKDGRGLVLLDGVDEIPHASRDDLRNAVESLVNAYPKSYFVLTTRPEAVDPGWLDDLAFREVQVVPMAESARNQFIQQWFEAVARGKNSPELREKAEELIRDLGSAPWLTPLVTNPLLCAMTCALYQARRGFLPNGLRQMCEVLCEMMLHRLDLERKIDMSKFRHPYPELQYEHKKAVMRQLAYHFVINEHSALPVPQAQQQVGIALSRMPDRNRSEADAVFDCILERSGMIREAISEDEKTKKPATIEFLHNTFKEFLAGEQIASERNAGMVLKNLDHEAWRRVGVFAFAAGDAMFQNELLTGVFQRLPEKLPKPHAGKRKSKPDDVDKKARELAVFALQCRGQATQCDEGVKERLNNIVVQLVPPQNLTDATWLAAAGNVVVPHLKYEKRLSNVQIACVRALKLIGTPEALRALEKYGADDRQSVLDELEGRVLLTSPKVTSLRVAYKRPISNLSFPSGLTNLTHLSLRDIQATDVSTLSILTKLTTLDLNGPQVTDVSVLSSLTKLTHIYLRTTRMSDASVLSGLTNLTNLYLEGTRVTDVSPLAGLTNLTTLDLEGTQAGLAHYEPVTAAAFTSISGLLWRNPDEYSAAGGVCGCARPAPRNEEQVA